MDNKWNKLSMRDKSNFMKVAIKNGIYDLEEIKKSYNEFAYGGQLGNIYDGEGDEPNILDKLDKAAEVADTSLAALQLAGAASTATGIGATVGVPVYAYSSIGSMGVDAYQALRESYKMATDDSVDHFYQSPHAKEAGLNALEFVLDLLPLKAIMKGLNKGVKAGIAAEKALTETERAALSNTRRVGSGAGRIAKQKSAMKKLEYNAARNKALEESRVAARQKTGINPNTKSPHRKRKYEKQVLNEMSKKGFGVTEKQAKKISAKKAIQNARYEMGINAIQNGYTIYRNTKD